MSELITHAPQDRSDTSRACAQAKAGELVRTYFGEAAGDDGELAMAAMEELIRWFLAGGQRQQEQVVRPVNEAPDSKSTDPSAFEQRLEEVLLSSGFPARHPILLDWARVKFALRELDRLKAVIRDRRPGGCSCAACKPLSLESMRMIVCEQCGSKRCPHATDHRLACTNSNDSGQAGSSYGRLLVAGPTVACAEDLELIASRLESFAPNGPAQDGVLLLQAARICRQVAAQESYGGGPTLPDPHPITAALDEVRSLCRDFSGRDGSVYIGDVEAALDRIEGHALAYFAGWLGQQRQAGGGDR